MYMRVVKRMHHDVRRLGCEEDIMTRFRIYPMFAVAALALAQAQPPATASQDGGWRKMGPAAQDTSAPPDNSAPPAPAAADPNYQQNAPPPQAIPPQLTLKPGTYVTVRINQLLSSDRNHAGDAFSATLVRPIVVDGVVVADRGQTLGGKVTEAKKAGRVEGTSRLGIQLTDLPVVDGQQMPITTSLISRTGPTSVGRDAAAIAGTTALGAAVGAAADWGRGAAIGAGAGAAVGIIGVLLTRGHPTYIGPESVLTFRVDQPVTIATTHAPQAFRFIEPGEYNAQPGLQARPGPGYGAPPPGYPTAAYYAPGYSPYGYPYPYAYAYPYPYYWGGFYGAGFYFGPGFYRGGFRGGFRR
jgi:hypothetical protein